METYSTPKEGTSFVPERGFYQPSTEDTREAYQALISIIEQQLGVRPDYLMYVAAEEILSVLKSGFFEYEFERKLEIEKILRPIPFHIFDQMVSIGKVITDYNPGIADPEQGFYQPRTEDTWTAYKNLIDVLGTMIGHQPLIDQCTIAHGVLLILKDESIHAKNKRRLIERHLFLDYKLLDQTFKSLVEIARQIWDFDEFRRVGVERYVGGYREEGIGPSWGVQEGAGGISWESDREMNGGDVVFGWDGKVNADGGGGYWGDGWGEGVKAGGGWSTQFAMDMADEVKKGAIDGGGDGWGSKINAGDGWSNPFAMDMVDEVKKGVIDGGDGGWGNEVNTGWSMQGSKNGFDGFRGWGEYGESSSKFAKDNGQDEIVESNEKAVNGGGVDLSVLKLDSEANDKVLVDGISDLSIHEIKDKNEANESDLAMEKGNDLDMSVLKLDDDKDENDSHPMQKNAEKDEEDDWVMVDVDGTDK